MHMDLETCVPWLGKSFETGWFVNSNFARNKKELIAKDRGRTSQSSDEGFLLVDLNENSNDYASWDVWNVKHQMLSMTSSRRL